jgi:hypothetical protein
MFKCQCPDAKLSNNTLALSLPDAVTPVVWVMDIASEGTFLVKVEKNEGGYYVLQKVSTKGKIEDIAFYHKRAKAIRAMLVITNALDTNVTSKFSLLSLMKIFILSVVTLTIIALGYILYKPAMSITSTLWNGSGATQTLRNSNKKLSQSTVPIIETENPAVMGVPMSADDFLNNAPNRQAF